MLQKHRCLFVGYYYIETTEWSSFCKMNIDIILCSYFCNIIQSALLPRMVTAVAPVLSTVRLCHVTSSLSLVTVLMRNVSPGMCSRETVLQVNIIINEFRSILNIQIHYDQKWWCIFITTINQENSCIFRALAYMYSKVYLTMEKRGFIILCSFFRIIVKF